MKPAICVKNLSKQYTIGSQSKRGDYQTLREVLSSSAATCWRGLRRGFSARKSSPDECGTGWQTYDALKDVSFDVRPGEVIGLIGRNGAGKSTLLKVLSRITEPTQGRVELRGRVGSLLEVGTGFHPELTGRENIYLNGAILGMSRREINRKFDEIVAFAEIDEFLDTPVKRYSSGMYVRLAFAVAAHLDLDILLLDEVLAVGDRAFQAKCLGKMGEVSRGGCTVVLVSHNMASIANLCRKVILIERGRMAFTGDVQEGIARYLASASELTGGEQDLTGHPNRPPGMQSHFRAVRLRNKRGELISVLECGEPLRLEFDVELGSHPTDYNVHVSFADRLGVRLITVGTTFSQERHLRLGGKASVVCDLDQLPLVPGSYDLSLVLGPTYKPAIDSIEQATRLEIVEADFFGSGRLPVANEGQVLLKSHWTVEANRA